jgi:plastocyanin
VWRPALVGGAAAAVRNDVETVAGDHRLNRKVRSMMAQGTVHSNEIRARPGLDWQRLSLLVAGAAFSGHLVIGAAYRDVDAFGIAASLAVAVGLTRLRRGTVGLALLGLAFANIAFWTVPATVTNVAGRSGSAAIAVPGVMAVLAVTGLVATVGTLQTRRRAEAGGSAATWVGAAAGGLVVILGLAALYAGGTPGAERDAQPGDIALTSDRTAFSETELVARAGTIGVHLENRDYFWHTFTITELDVDLRVPVSASGRVTFEATPGTYEFVCAIPGHDIAGMVGTLTVVGD